MCKLIEMRKKIYRFLAVGTIAFLVDFGCARFFIGFMPRVPSLVLAYLMSCLFHYLSSKYWAFEDISPLALRQVWLYALVNSITLVANITVTNIMMMQFKQELLVSKAIALPPASILGFFLLRLFVFRSKL